MKTRIVNSNNTLYDVYIGKGSIWFPRSSVPYEQFVKESPELMKKLPTLRLKTLGCQCTDLNCHGYIIIKMLKDMGLIGSNPDTYRLLDCVYYEQKDDYCYSDDNNAPDCRDCKKYDNNPWEGRSYNMVMAEIMGMEITRGKKEKGVFDIL